MEVTNELITKFFRQECTPEERLFISEYFDQHPDELDKYIGDDDWQNFEADAALHPAVSQKMLQHIEGNIDVPRSIGKTNVKRLIAAASVILVAGSCLFIGLQWAKTKQNTGSQVAANQIGAQVIDTVINKTGKELIVRLPDGSKVLLSAQSFFVYNKAFNQTHRDIYLTGEAVFKVAKDKTRPFTVYASGLSTTALGTCFRVSAFNGASEVLVKLYEGKVVIKHVQKTAGVLDTDVYLTPGYELLWHNGLKKGRVAAFNNPAKPVVSPASAAGIKTEVHFIKFNNELLASVLNQVQLMYGIRIKVADRSLDNKFFTGTVNSHKETADDVLHTIAMLNKFNLKKQGDTYTLLPGNNMPADSAARSEQNE